MYPQLAAAAVVTTLAVGWLLCSAAGNPLGYDDIAKTRRSAAEEYFTLNAFAYSVGWCHITYLRDMITLTRVAARGAGPGWAQAGEPDVPVTWLQPCVVAAAALCAG